MHKRTLIELLFLVVLVGTATVVATYAYQQGYGSGYSNGHKDGTTQGHKAGYDAGLKDGYTNGYTVGQGNGETLGYNQGKTDELGNLLDWETNSCSVYLNGYYYIKLWKAYDGSTKYSCLVQ